MWRFGRCFLLDTDDVKEKAKEAGNKTKEAGEKVEDKTKEGWNKLKKKF